MLSPYTAAREEQYQMPTLHPPTRIVKRKVVVSVGPHATSFSHFLTLRPIHTVQRKKTFVCVPIRATQWAVCDHGMVFWALLFSEGRVLR